MIQCIALDDEPLALVVIQSFCDNLPYINLSHTFTQVSLAQKHIRRFPVDLIFLDIEMPDCNGFDFYKSINQKTMVIFITAYSNYAVQGFNINAIDYLLKPIELERFNTACSKAKYFFEYSNSIRLLGKSEIEDSLYVRSEYALIKIPYDTIQYLETMDDYIKIHTSENKTILTLMSMNKIVEKLPKEEFLRVHRSYAVSVSKISSKRGKTLFLKEITIPIGSSYKERVDVFYSSKKQ